MKAYEYLSSPGKWCQGANHRDEDGDECGEESAVSSCGYGAIKICYPGSSFSLRMRLEARVHELYGFDNLEAWNDTPATTWKMVHGFLKMENV